MPSPPLAAKAVSSGLRVGTAADDVEVDDLDRRVEAVGVGALVERVEPLVGSGDVDRPSPLETGTRTVCSCPW